ncbi:MAG: VOC family protein [Deltaproteobacteria bacterium]|nr:VOC family protein [Deltaproteobacteria bacterium]
MSVDATPSSQTIYSALFYRDALAAIAWLKEVLGFEERLVVPGPESSVAHAELSFEGAVIMLGTSQQDRGWKSPLDLAGINQLTYLVAEDVDSLYQRVQAAGAEIAIELQEMEYGSREFTVRDPEGHFWSIGTYRPGGVGS